MSKKKTTPAVLDSPNSSPREASRVVQPGGSPPDARPSMSNLEESSKDEHATPAPPAGIPAFDSSKFRLPQNFHDTAGVKKRQVVVPVEKPPKTAFVRVRPGEEHRMTAVVLEAGDAGRECYLIRADLAAELMATETACRPVQLVTGVTRTGGVFLWPHKLPGPDGRTNPWNDSALEAAKAAETRWVRVVANQALGHYDVYEATGDLPEPEWPSETFAELLAIAFRGKVIDSLDHPVLRKLRGEV